MTKGEQAIALAVDGFFVFPIQPNVKAPPALQNWQDKATRDPFTIGQWWAYNPNYNIGIYTGRFDDTAALLVVDVDVKEAINGYDTLLRLELEGWELPETRCHLTPSSGRHYFYRVPTSVRQGTGLLGPGLDVRSRGGYVVAAGSTLASGVYAIVERCAIADAPQWLIDRCQPADRPVLGVGHSPIDLNPDTASERIRHYLECEAPLAIEGLGGDQTTYAVAARCKDFGASIDDCREWMERYWNPRCAPPWTSDALMDKIANAYRYGQNPPACDAPEVVFAAPVNGTPVNGAVHPINKFNSEYSFVLSEGDAHILWETTKANGMETVQHINIPSFKLKFAADTMIIGKKEVSTAAEWLRSKKRRSYDGIVFEPGQDKTMQNAGKSYFNLWRGFTVAPSAPATRHDSVDAFLEHAQENVCGGNAILYTWLIGYFAHLIQRPWEKPLVSLVFRGGKGVGKNALVERVGSLLGSHFLLTSNRRYLVGNFNGHLENLLLFALDEAFWSGDKAAEGTLKDLITGQEHVIEHKGSESYTVANKTRVVIIGNEEWLIPATHDERRFAVFDVGEGRKQDVKFFTDMREGMEHGGYSVLLRYLLDFDCTGLNPSVAPSTQGLVDQKLHSMNPFYHWWHSCLEAGKLIGVEFVEWPATIECDQFRNAFRRYAKDQGMKCWHHEDTLIGKFLKKCLPSIAKHRVRREEGLTYEYQLPSIAVCRAEWDTFMSHPTEWEAL